MLPKERHLLPLLLFLFLWKARDVKAYDGICDEPHTSMYCTCETKHRDIAVTVTCFITNSLSSDDEVWRSLGSMENVVNLKLHSMLDLKIDYIPTESIKRLDSLQTLIIQQGNLSQLESGALSDFAELQELNLEDCEITSLQPRAISNLPKLKKLSLGFNLLQEVLAESFLGLFELEQLFLDRNNISRFEICAFCDLQNLKELELWGNQISDLTEYMFRGLRQLRRLDLYKNKIRILNDKIFHSMEKLAEIDLHDNLIDHIAPHAFQGLEKLQRLMLNSNQIKSLPDLVFESLPNLRSVDLYNNKLETLQVEVLEHMPKSKDEHFSLIFKDNPLKCDCRLNWVESYLKHNKSHQFTRELNELKCKPDGENQTLQVVHLLKMGCELSTEPKNLITTSRSVTKPAVLVPYQIHGHKNMSKNVTTVISDDYSSTDSESQEAMEMESESDNENSASLSLTGDIHTTLCIVLLTLFLVRKRKSTPL